MLKRKEKKIISSLMIAVSLVGSGLVVFSQLGFAAVPAPTPTPFHPNIDEVYELSNPKNVGFSGYGVISGGYTQRVRIMYRKVGTSQWWSFGNTPKTAPDGTQSKPNGIISTNPSYFVDANGYGALKTYNPNCLPCSSGYMPLIHPGNTALGLGAGKYAWSVQAQVNSGLPSGSGTWTVSSWSRLRYFTINPVPPPPPKDDPEPEDPTPDPIDIPEPSIPITNPSDDYLDPVVDKEAPSVPEGLAGEFDSGNNSINLVWNASVDDNEVVGYEVERVEKGGATWEKVGDTGEELFEDFNFEPNKAYQYRVRAYDQIKNYSAYSAAIDVVAGQFTPNVTANEGGTVQDADAAVILEFPSGAVNEDIFISVERTEGEGVKIEGNNRLVGNVYDIKAKNNRGEEVKKFETQITIKFNFANTVLKGVNKKTLKISTVKDENVVFEKTLNDFKADEAITLTDHLSLYFLTAERANPWLTFLSILFWILMAILVGVGGYYGYQYYLRRKYQQEHREDFIYKH